MHFLNNDKNIAFGFKWAIDSNIQAMLKLLLFGCWKNNKILSQANELKGGNVYHESRGQEVFEGNFHPGT